MLCGLPSLTTTIALLFFPESPRYLLSQGDEEGALEVFRHIFKVNTGKPKQFYPVRKIDLFSSLSCFKIINCYNSLYNSVQ